MRIVAVYLRVVLIRCYVSQVIVEVGLPTATDRDDVSRLSLGVHLAIVHTQAEFTDLNVTR
jgi:hypothetical protein